MVENSDDRNQRGQSLAHFKSKYDAATSGFEMTFAILIGSRHLWRRGSKPKHVSKPDYVIKHFNPHLIHDTARQDKFATTVQIPDVYGAVALKCPCFCTQFFSFLRCFTSQLSSFMHIS